MKFTPNVGKALTLLTTFITFAAATPALRQTKTTSTTTASSTPDGSLEGRIIGGTAARAGQYPFFVQWDGCGAALIHSDIIISAAHCNQLPSNQVIIGNTVLGSTSGGGTVKRIVKRVIQPNYNRFPRGDDFLVMKLDSNATQKPIALNSNSNYPTSNQDLTVIGFGSLSNGGQSLSSTLQQVTVNYVPQQACDSSYPGEIDPTTMLCAGAPNGGKDSCQGDSGGPIFDSNGVLVGVVSWGNGCGLKGFPGIYSRISGRYSWIQQQICALSSYPPESCSSGSSGNKPTPPPSLPPSSGSSKCSDTSTTFNVDSTAGNQGCSWLSSNLNRFGYLCKFVDVGRACPVTCNLCGVFAR